MLSVKVDYLGDITIFRCAGRLIFHHADELLKAAWARPRVRVAFVDLAEITAIDAAGVGVLVSLRARAMETNTTLKLMNLPPAVERLLEVTNLRPVFEVCSVQDMLELLCLASESARTSNAETEIHPPEPLRMGGRAEFPLQNPAREVA